MSRRLIQLLLSAAASLLPLQRGRGGGTEACEGSMLTRAARCSVGGTTEYIAAIFGHRNCVSSADGSTRACTGVCVCVRGGQGGVSSEPRVRACACVHACICMGG